MRRDSVRVRLCVVRVGYSQVMRREGRLGSWVRVRVSFVIRKHGEQTSTAFGRVYGLAPFTCTNSCDVHLPIA